MAAPLIVGFLGLPGSGKTTFARQLARKLDGVVLTADAARMSMWGSREAIDATRTTPEARKYSNQLVFGALNYAAKQIAGAGHSVIFDAIMSYRHERQAKYDLGEELGITVVLVRIKVPYEVSLRRMQEREAADDQRQFTEEKAIGVLEHFSSELQEPTDDEPVIYIDGEMPFEEQYEVFLEGLAAITNKNNP